LTNEKDPTNTACLRICVYLYYINEKGIRLFFDDLTASAVF